jgi:hypothetical protein
MEVSKNILFLLFVRNAAEGVGHVQKNNGGLYSWRCKAIG